MERLKNMGLKKSFLVLSAFCVLLALLLLWLVFMACNGVSRNFPAVGLEILSDGTVIRQPERLTERQQRIASALGVIQFVSCIVFPVGGLAVSGVLYYHMKLKEPIAALRNGIERIQNHDLDFALPVRSEDELGQLCAAFDTMREELLKSNRELWRQAEERKRLNAAFSHDLRNPITVLKGTVKLLRQGRADEQAIDRLESYTLRIEQYVEAMSGIQRLEQMPVRVGECAYSLLCSELEETAKLLAGGLECFVSGDNDSLAGAGCGQMRADYGSVWINRDAMGHDHGLMGSNCSSMGLEHSSLGNDCDSVGLDYGTVWLDHGLFLTVAENLIGNAARFAKSNILIHLERQGDFLLLSVTDDGPGYPEKLVQDGPKPFGKIKTEDGVGALNQNSAHFGMGLYGSQILCMKHGGTLKLENETGYGARAVASFLVGHNKI